MLPLSARGSRRPSTVAARSLSTPDAAPDDETPLPAPVVATADAQAPVAPDFELPADSAVPFLVMRQTPTELAGGHTLVLRVFADGRCELERPPIMRGAGLHRWTLPPDEVPSLARQAIDAGVAVLDGPALQAELRAERLRRDEAERIHRLDDDVIEIELRLDRLRGAGGEVRRDIDRRLRIIGLRGERANHADDVRLVRLSELRDRLDAMAALHAPVPPQVPARSPTPPTSGTEPAQ